jgi:hypothetical protein
MGASAGCATSLKSGLEAAHAVVEALYLKAVDELLVRFREVSSFGQRVAVAMASEDPKAYADALLEAWNRALNLFSRDPGAESVGSPEAV